MQTPDSYARLIWVRHLHGISGNCQSPETRVETRLSGHIRTAKTLNTPKHARSFIESIVRKVALIRCSLCLTSYAGGTLRKKHQRFWRMPSVRSVPPRITGLPGQLQPDDDVGLFIACLPNVSRHCGATFPRFMPAPSAPHQYPAKPSLRPSHPNTT